MSEKLPFRASPQESANFVDCVMHGRANSISLRAKSLTEIDPIVAGFVDVDPKSIDFGRIEKVATAHNMANQRNDIYDDEHMPVGGWGQGGADRTEPLDSIGEEFDDDIVDRQVAAEVRMAAFNTHTPEGAKKAAQDYLITQGNRDTMGYRSMEISEDLHSRTVNPYLAARDILDSIKLARAARKAKREK